MANRRGSYAADARGPGALPGAAADAGRLSPLPVGRWLLAVTRVPGTAPADQCGDPSNGADDYFAVKDRRLGRSLRSRLRGAKPAPLDCGPHGKPIGTYQVGRAVVAAELGEQIRQQLTTPRLLIWRSSLTVPCPRRPSTRAEDLEE